MKFNKILIALILASSFVLISGCKTTIPYIPASSEVPYGFVRGDELHRTMRFDQKTGTYVKRDKPEIVVFDFDGIAASYAKWKGRDSKVDGAINNIGE